MIRVTVDLVPFGDESAKKKIGSLTLANVGSKLGMDTGTYWYQCVYEDDITGTHLSEVDHVRSDGVWELLHKLLDPNQMISEPEDKDEIFDLLKEKMKWTS